jgi:hypothetical protein
MTMIMEGLLNLLAKLENRSKWEKIKVLYLRCCCQYRVDNYGSA